MNLFKRAVAAIKRITAPKQHPTIKHRVGAVDPRGERYKRPLRTNKQGVTLTGKHSRRGPKRTAGAKLYRKSLEGKL